MRPLDELLADPADAPAGTNAFSRRSLLKAGGALVIFASLPGLVATRGAGAATGPVANAFDPSQLSSWIAVQADNTVLVRTGKLEMGVGIRTGLMQLVAEELYVPFDAVKLIMGDTDETPDGGYSAGGTISFSYQTLSKVAAYGRQALLDLASAHFGVPADRLTVEDGVVSSPAGGSISYAQLVEGQVLEAVVPTSGSPLDFAAGVKVLGDAPLKDPSQYTIIGRPIQRVDLPAKLTGETYYLGDLRLPGMLHARMVRPKTLGSTLVRVDGFGKQKFPGARVVVKGNLVGVVSPDEWEAVQAAEALKVTWSDWKGLPGSDSIGPALRASANPKRSSPVQKGDAIGTLTAAGMPISASYVMPVVQHAPIGPHVAVADVHADGTIDVYSCSSILQVLRKGIAQMMTTTIDKVVVHHLEHSSQYGRTSLGGDDPAADAVILSAEVGAPVRVQWSRAEDHVWSCKVQPSLHDMHAAVDAQGNLTAWHHLNFSAAWDSRMLGAILAGAPGSTTPAPPGGGWSAYWIYDKVPNVLIESQGISDFGSDAPNGVGMRFNIMRSPGNLQSAFGMESFMNEVAMQAKADPIEFRLRHTTDPRAIAVLQEVRKLSQWSGRPSPAPHASATGSDEVTGRGVALALRDDGTGQAYVAGVCEVAVTPATGKVRVTQFWIANDSGLVVNPTGLGRVIESGVIQGTSLALKEEVTFDASTITSEDWTSYPLLTMAETPEIEWVFVGNEHGNPPEPAGEPISNVVQPAIVAAFLDATGKPMRRLPLKPKYVKAALQA